MNLTLLVVMVLVQIVAFQYGATKIVRTAASLPPDDKSVSAEVRERLTRLHHQIRRAELLLGGILIAAVVAVVVVLPLSYHPRKIALAVISLTSTAGLLAAYMATYRDLFRLAEKLPDPTRRVAELSPRRLGNYYPLWFEVLPWGVVAATLVMTGVILARPASLIGWGDVRAWGMPLFQIALNLFLLWTAVARVRSHYCLPIGRKIWADQEEYLRLEEELRGIQTRASLWSRTWIMLLCGMIQLRVLDVVTWARPAVNFLAIGMSLYFVVHITRVARHRRTIQATAQPVAGSKGGLS